MGYLRFFGHRIKEKIKGLGDWFIKLLPIYYTSINYRPIPIANWYRLKDGDMGAIYRIRLFKRIPNFFGQVFINMTKEFENIDLTLLNQKWQAAKIASMAARLNNKNFEFQATQAKKQIAIKEQKLYGNKGMSLNEFLDYIELTLFLFFIIILTQFFH